MKRLLKNRLYKSGSIWAVWRWTDVPTGHIVRLHLLKTPWFAIDLHWLINPDPENHLHDHPVSFLSIILHGSYVELRSLMGQKVFQYHRWFNYISAEYNDCHRIVGVDKNTLTLCFMGPKIREWGFHVKDHWVYWKDYYKSLTNV